MVGAVPNNSRRIELISFKATFGGICKSKVAGVLPDLGEAGGTSKWQSSSANGKYSMIVAWRV